MDVHSVVVRTTETMAIHSSSLCRGENHEMMTKRIYVFATMRVLVLGQLQRPETERTRGAGWQSQTVACGGGGEVARFDMARDHTPVFHRQRRRTYMTGREPSPNSDQEGRAEKRTSPSLFSASRALRETKPRSKRPTPPRDRRAAEPHPQPRCICCSALRMEIHPENAGKLRNFQVTVTVK